MQGPVVTLRWAGEGLRFEGGAEGGPAVRLDGAGAAGASPMQSLLLALGGCTAADVVDILGKMRVPLEGVGVEVRLESERAPDPPRRYTRIRLLYRVSGLAAEHEAKVRRAVALSHETYCSVLHTLRADTALETEVQLG
jgi:putative redox protein